MNRRYKEKYIDYMFHVRGTIVGGDLGIVVALLSKLHYTFSFNNINTDLKERL